MATSLRWVTSAAAPQRRGAVGGLHRVKFAVDDIDDIDDIEMGMDWREAEPVTLDVDAIRASGHYTDAQLIDAASERDPGFEAGIFTTQLQRVTRLTEDDLKETD